MIHYTLLPEKEAGALRLEYKIRILIVLLFFVSSAVIVGIISLIPGYVISSIKENELTSKLEELKKSKEARGIDATIVELKQGSDILRQIQQDVKESSFANAIQNTVSAKLPKAIFASMQISSIAETNSTSTNDSSYEVLIQGKSATRESLLEFKRNIEKNPIFSKVEFPIPDLTKTKDVAFAIKVKLKKIKWK